MFRVVETGVEEDVFTAPVTTEDVLVLVAVGVLRTSLVREPVDKLVAPITVGVTDCVETSNSVALEPPLEEPPTGFTLVPPSTANLSDFDFAVPGRESEVITASLFPVEPFELLPPRCP